MSSEQGRDASDPLHRINLTLARARDLTSRLRRRSWPVSERARLLHPHLMAFACHRNDTQPRFDGEARTPAERLGFVHRRTTLREHLSWRQDHGERSIHQPRFGTVGERRVERAAESARAT